MRIRPLAAVLSLVFLSVGATLVAWHTNSRQAERASLPGAPPTPLISPEEVSGYVGSAACGGCHPDEHRTHLLTTHARTLARIDDSPVKAAFASEQTLYDPIRRATYGFALKDGTATSRVEVAGDGSPVEVSADYAVGSGKIGVTFLSERDGRFSELRASHYHSGWGWTPGQQRPDPRRPAWGKPLEDRTAAACFLCHSTAVSHDGARLLPEPSLFNIGCERCHGPGREHVRAVEAGKAPGPIYGLKNLSAGMVQKLCDACHGPPVPMTERELAAFADLPRFAAPGLALSKCFKQGDGKLSCVSCHDPHAQPSRDPGAYERVCLGCHKPATPAATTCPVNPQDDCITCHMPKLPVDFPVPLAFRTHWIKPYPRSKTAK